MLRGDDKGFIISWYITPMIMKSQVELLSDISWKKKAGVAI